MKNLITGGAGFIGSHLADYLINKGEEVVIIDDLSTGLFNNIKHLIDKNRFSYIIGSVTEKRLLEKAVEGVDRIYHLAAAVGVKFIVDDPVHTIETNIIASQAVLKTAVTFGKRVLISSTSEVYGKRIDIPFSENDDLVYGPTSKARWSYAVSKAIDEYLVLAYHEKKGLPGIIVRLFNTVGPRQVGQYGMVVPRFVQQAINNEPITIYGTGKQTRCFIHVMDVVPALYSLMNCDTALGEIINIGNDSPITIENLAKKVRKIVNPEVEIIKIPYERAYGKGFEDLGARMPNLQKLRNLIDFNPLRNIDDVINDVQNFLKKI
jgi:UDP-glucose 4-epimerase